MAKKTKPARYTLAELVTPYQWVDQGRGGPHFNTFDRLDWFIRKHRDELIAAGEFIPGRGARSSLIGPGFDTLAVDILRRTSAA